MHHKRPNGISRAITNFTFMLFGFWLLSEATIAPQGSAKAYILWVTGFVSLLAMFRYRVSDWLTHWRSKSE